MIGYLMKDWSVGFDFELRVIPFDLVPLIYLSTYLAASRCLGVLEMDSVGIVPTYLLLLLSLVLLLWLAS